MRHEILVPHKHLRMWADAYCSAWKEGDRVFVIGKTYQKGEVGENYPKCPVCWPKKPEKPKP